MVLPSFSSFNFPVPNKFFPSLTTSFLLLQPCHCPHIHRHSSHSSLTVDVLLSLTTFFTHRRRRSFTTALTRSRYLCLTDGILPPSTCPFSRYLPHSPASSLADNIIALSTAAFLHAAYTSLIDGMSMFNLPTPNVFASLTCFFRNRQHHSFNHHSLLSLTVHLPHSEHPSSILGFPTTNNLVSLTTFCPRRQRPYLSHCIKPLLQEYFPHPRGSSSIWNSQSPNIHSHANSILPPLTTTTPHITRYESTKSYKSTLIQSVSTRGRGCYVEESLQSSHIGIVVPSLTTDDPHKPRSNKTLTHRLPFALVPSSIAD